MAWKAVLRVIQVVSQRPADTPDHRPMALHQGSESELGVRSVTISAGRDKSFEQLTVVQSTQTRPPRRVRERTRVTQVNFHAPSSALISRSEPICARHGLDGRQLNNDARPPFVPDQSRSSSVAQRLGFSPTGNSRPTVKN